MSISVELLRMAITSTNDYELHSLRIGSVSYNMDELIVIFVRKEKPIVLYYWRHDKSFS